MLGCLLGLGLSGNAGKEFYRKGCIKGDCILEDLLVGMELTVHWKIFSQVLAWVFIILWSFVWVDDWFVNIVTNWDAMGMYCPCCGLWS